MRLGLIIGAHFKKSEALELIRKYGQDVAVFPFRGTLTVKDLMDYETLAKRCELMVIDSRLLADSRTAALITGHKIVVAGQGIAGQDVAGQRRTGDDRT